MIRTSWTTPIGDARLNRALRHQDLARQQAETMARVARETGGELPRIAKGATAGGDERRLRGIPAIGRGVQGAIAGTRP